MGVAHSMTLCYTTQSPKATGTVGFQWPPVVAAQVHAVVAARHDTVAYLAKRNVAGTLECRLAIDNWNPARVSLITGTLFKGSSYIVNWNPLFEHPAICAR